MNTKGFDRAFAIVRPPPKFTLGKSFLAHPESLTIIGKNLNGSLSPVKKYKQIPGKRICPQNRFAQHGQAIYTFSKINRLNGQKYPHMWSDLDHACLIQNDLLSSRRSKSVLPLKHIFILEPLLSSISTTHSEMKSG